MASRRKPKTIDQIIRIRVNSANYRAKNLGIPGTLVAVEVQAKCWREDMPCPFCQRRLTPRLVSLDHLTPLSRGGDNTLGNVHLCCVKCNRYRRNATCQEYSEFLQHLGPFTDFFFKNYRPRGWR